MKLNRNKLVNFKANLDYKNQQVHDGKTGCLLKTPCMALLFALTYLSSSSVLSGEITPPQASLSIGASGTANTTTMEPDYSDLNSVSFNPQAKSAPAWAQGTYQKIELNKLIPFGSELFKGNFANTYQTEINPEYKISSGDRIVIRMWGAKTYESELAVDIQGNIFIPEIGPIQVKNCTVNNLVSTIKAAVNKVFTNNVELYVNLKSSQPIAVFVTGGINNPGRYAGNQTVNILSYIDRAGGINANSGSYRKIHVKRNNQIIQSIDLYKFLVNGEIPIFTLKNDDVIVIEHKQLAISAYGLIKRPATYEFTQEAHSGQDLLEFSSLGANVTHVQITGVKNGSSFSKYMSLKDFNDYQFNPDDRIMFISDDQPKNILASVIGPINGNSRFIVTKGTHLKDVLANVKVDPSIADINSIYLRRKSVAAQQKIIIADALKRLEQSSLTAQSSSIDEASIRVKEAELIQDFVKRAQAAQPDGVVVVSTNGQMKDLLLEDGDEIVIPQKSSVVQIGGEIMMPKAIVYDPTYTLLDYIKDTGGFTQRADQDNILIILPNGQVGKTSELSLTPGSRVIVMPKVDSKNMQLAKDVMQIIYQIAVATKVAVGL